MKKVSFFNFKVGLLTLIILMFSLYTVRIFGSLTVADAGMIMFILSSIVIYKRVSINHFSVFYFVWAVIIGLSFFYYSRLSFFETEKFFSTYLRILTSVVSVFFIPLWLRDGNDSITFIKAIKLSIVALVISQFVVVACFYLGLSSVFNIIPHGDQSSRGNWLNIYNYTYYYRFGGLFEEPSWFSWFFTFLLGISIVYEKKFNTKVISNKLIIASFIAIVMTFSLAGIISFVLLCLIKFYKKSLVKSTLVICIFTLIIFIIVYYLNAQFIDRVIFALSGDDGSSNNRLLGSLFRTALAIEQSLMGFGIGNSINGILFYSNQIGASLTSSISTQNGFSEDIISCGIILGIAYLAPIAYLGLKRNGRIGFVVITLVFFTTSSIFVTPMWFFIATIFLLSSQKSSKNTNQTAHL
ncbi:O-antigen ligase family protein [Providencia stuartii]|uniref:O-antigen ligase family protein n=1 Tax=Providencia stuartii TaxID=588 RepID=UPI0013CF6D46|nr:O-antigen ligase family protein [Providencia stuartii]